MKMIVTVQIKILDKENKQNEVQYDLDKKAAIISASSSIELVDKYEYLTGKDLDLKPSTTEQAKFEYYPLSKVLLLIKYWIKMIKKMACLSG